MHHGILLDKLEYYGTRDLTNDFITYVLTSKQGVVWIGSTSGACVSNVGVLQGSILGPLLFATYAYDGKQDLTTFIYVFTSFYLYKLLFIHILFVRDFIYSSFYVFKIFIVNSSMLVRFSFVRVLWYL